MMKSGSVSTNRALRACRSRTRGWLQKNHTLGLGPSAAQRNCEPRMAGEVAALRDRTHERSSEHIESKR